MGGSSRIPLFFTYTPLIAQNRLVHNLTATIDLLPTLIQLGGGKPATDISGFSLLDLLTKTSETAETSQQQRPSYVTSQYHSNMGNTGSFMVRKAQWKYIQFGHFLRAFANYQPQLFDVDADAQELHDVSNLTQNADVVSELEAILAAEFNYEYVDCIAKFNDFVLFEEFQWKANNKSALQTKLKSAYSGFDDNDWQTVVDWRMEMLNVTNTTCEEHAERWLRPVREEERRDWFVDVMAGV